MATLFKPTRPFPLPADAEILDREGKPHVRLREGGKPVFYPVTKDGTKYLKPAKKWYTEFHDASGVRKRVVLSPNKDAAQLMLAAILKRVELEKGGHNDPYQTHRKTPLTTHRDDWLAVLTARGRDEEYTALKAARVNAIFDGCGFVFPPDLSAEKLERFLESLRTGTKRLSVQTTNDYLQAVSQFCNWLVENDRIEKNPFDSVKKGNAERDRRHVRRVLDAAELQTLVTSTRTIPTVRRGLTGEARALLYAVGAYTGYRAGELAALTVAALNLDAEPPSIDLDGRFTKNGKPARQPVPDDLAGWLRGSVVGLPASAPVWPGKWMDRPSELIQKDAAAAGLPLEVETKDGTQVLDFHSLRGTFATLLDGLDISLKARQELMRHSDPRLTLNRYTRAKRHDLGAAVQRFANLNAPDPTRESTILRATGTEDGCSSDAVPDAVAGGDGGGRLRVVGETDDSDDPPGGSSESQGNQGVEGNRGDLKTVQSGEGGIRTRGGVLPPRRFSKAVLSTTQPPLQSHTTKPSWQTLLEVVGNRLVLYCVPGTKLRFPGDSTALSNVCRRRKQPVSRSPKHTARITTVDESEAVSGLAVIDSCRFYNLQVPGQAGQTWSSPKGVANLPGC